MDLVYNNGQGNNEAVVYEGASADGLSYTIRRNNGTRLSVPDRNLAFLQQMGMHHIPSTSLEYCKEVGVGLTKEEAQSMARPRTLTPLEQEPMSWHHRLYHLPFCIIFMLARKQFCQNDL